MKIYIGIDNGVSGSIGIITEQGYSFFKTPVFKELDYTKDKQFVTRLDFNSLMDKLQPYKNNSVAILERPMVNPGRFTATKSAMRCHEATLITLAILGIPVHYIDSKEWQKEMLPKNLKKEELKEASFSVGNRLFPLIKEIKHKDRDGILIAQFAKNKKL